MPTIRTLGAPRIRKQFTYSGSVSTGVTLQFKRKAYVSSEFFKAIVKHFAGKTLPGGFNMTDPTPGGFGQWEQENSQELNSVRLTPRHASFIAAILAHEDLITSSLRGNAVYLHFGPLPGAGTQSTMST